MLDQTIRLYLQLEDINTREREYPVILLLPVSLRNQRRNAFKSSNEEYFKKMITRINIISVLKFSNGLVLFKYLLVTFFVLLINNSFIYFSVSFPNAKI